MKKCIRVFVFIFVIAMLPGSFQGLKIGIVNNNHHQLIPIASASDSCGAYVAPGVWKEFDCYNLAAIGKTTGDDPFTPSWRLIGGYWQWGRKGPDHSQWYDTNTEHFAHGPTGPSSGEANSGSISGWDQIDAPDGSWSEGSQAVWYLLDQEADLNKTDADGDGKVDLLLNINLNGIWFRVDNGVELSISFNKDLLLAQAETYQTGKVITHADFVAALQPGLAELITDGLVPADTILELDNKLTCSTYLDDGSRSSDIPAMVLRTQTDSILNVVGFKWVYDLSGEYNLFFRRIDYQSGNNDPCPEGFRVPTKSQWEGVIDNNTQSKVGTWSYSTTNYSSALFFGSHLMLPATGRRNISSGESGGRGQIGVYWSRSGHSRSGTAWYLLIDSYDVAAYDIQRGLGQSVRCISDSEDFTPCTYSISSSSDNFISSGGSSTVSVTASDSDCSWTTSNELPWASLSPTNGTGSGTVSVSVTTNTSAARSGSITIAGKNYRISQDVVPCTLDISSSSGTFPSSGGTKTLSLTASSSKCSWIAAPSLSWMTVSPFNGSGSRNVTVTVNPNGGEARSGSIMIGDKTYIVIQAAANDTPVSGLTKTQISQLYVSIFGRASEAEGNAYWQSMPDMATAASAMLYTDVSRDYFGANLNTNQAFIEHIYLNTLNKTISDDPDGISYWVGMLDAGTSRGQAVATLVQVIKNYAPGGIYYDPTDQLAINAYQQFMNRVKISDFMAQNIYDTPYDWEESTAFNNGLVVTNDPSTLFSALSIVNSFNNRTDDKNILMAEFIKNKWPAVFMTNTTTEILYPEDIMSEIDDIIFTNISQVQRNIEFEISHYEDRLRIVSIDSTGNDPLLLNIQIIGINNSEYSFILPAHVLQAEKALEETLQPFSEIGINSDNITILPDYSSFSEPTMITTFKLHDSIKDFFVSGDVLETYSIQIERQPKKPVSIKYKINNSQNPDDIIMAHMNSVGDIDYLYPHEYDSNSNELLFMLDSFCEMSFFTKEDLYDLNYTFSIKDIEQNPKEVFNYIAQLIDYIGDELKIQRLSYT